VVQETLSRNDAARQTVSRSPFWEDTGRVRGRLERKHGDRSALGAGGGGNGIKLRRFVLSLEVACASRGEIVQCERAAPKPAVAKVGLTGLTGHAAASRLALRAANWKQGLDELRKGTAAASRLALAPSHGPEQPPQEARSNGLDEAEAERAVRPEAASEARVPVQLAAAASKRSNQAVRPIDRGELKAVSARQDLFRKAEVFGGSGHRSNGQRGREAKEAQDGWGKR
jgi:hypothetical protein